MKKFFCCLAIAGCALSAHADIVSVAPSPTTPGSFQITAPLTFTITTASTSFNIIDLAAWVFPADGTNTSTPVLGSLSFTLKSTTASSTATLHDNYTTFTNSLAPNDGYFVLDSVLSVAAGDTFTLSAGSYGLGPASDFNAAATQTFRGSLFLADQSGNRISNIVSAVPGAVPEPSTWALLGAGVAGLGFAALRRCSAAACA